MTISRSMAAMILLLGAAGCAREEAGDGNVAAANMDHGSMGNMAANPADPFAEADAAMHRDMMAAVGVDAADSWVRKMIAHHQGAVDMSRAVLALNPTPSVRRMAEETIDRQGREIAELRAMVREGAPNAASAEHYRAGEEEMHDAMMAARAPNPSDLWIAKMIAHHQGALRMSDDVLAQDPPAEVRRMAEQTKVDQAREIAELQRMLQGGAAAQG